MLSSAKKFKSAFERYGKIDPLVVHDLSSRDGEPTTDDWDVVRKIVVMLKTFYDVTVKISDSKYVKSNNFWAEICDLYVALDFWKNSGDVQLSGMSIRMKQKFDKYWGNPKKMNKIIWFAVVLDPREKFEIVQISLKEIYGEECGSQIFDDVHSSFFALFHEYQKMHDVVDECCDVSIVSRNVELEKTTSSMFEPPKSVFKGMHKKQKVNSGGSRLGKITELAAYLDEILVEDDSKELDVLNWWRIHSTRFPILSIMARDILVVPISTVASASTFSTGGRVIDEYRNSLSPEVVEL
ncbi:Zinc finger BED domain-containing protein RICESLEEPER 2 [Euphorbia peplus]|nr:Zinc finger BED domain-containing protein RICESLEEPER 2 [Euphorbia peplus]